MTRDMANLQWMRSEGACPWRANPPGDDGDETGDERASTTADAVAVRVKGCDANGFRSTRTSRAVALKIDGYLGMSPATLAGMSGRCEDSALAVSPAASRSSAESKASPSKGPCSRRVLPVSRSRSSRAGVAAMLCRAASAAWARITASGRSLSRH